MSDESAYESETPKRRRLKVPVKRSAVGIAPALWDDDEYVECESAEAASHWDVRAWHRMR